MLSNKLIEYLNYTEDTKQTLNPNLRKQYDFQIREKVEEAISDFNLLLSSHSDDQLKKIFTDDRIEDLFQITEKALDVVVRNPNGLSSELKNHAYKHGLYLFQHIMPEPYYQSVYKVISNPVNYEKQALEHMILEGKVNDLTERLAITEELLNKHSVTKDDLDKEVYTQHNAKIIKNLEKQIAEGKLTPEQTKRSLDILKLPWEEYKKCRLDISNLFPSDEIKINITENGFTLVQSE